MNPWLWILLIPFLSIANFLAIILAYSVGSPLPFLGYLALWIVPAWRADRDYRRRNDPRRTSGWKEVKR